MRTSLDRRGFLQASAGVVAASINPALFVPPQRPLRLGLIVGIGPDPEPAIATVHDLGLPTCQVYVEEFGPAVGTRLLQALEQHNVGAAHLRQVVGHRAADDGGL